IGRIGNEIRAEFYRAQRSTPECLAEGIRLGHFFKCSDGIEFVESQFGEFDTIEGKLSIAFGATAARPLRHLTNGPHACLTLTNATFSTVNPSTCEWAKTKKLHAYSAPGGSSLGKIACAIAVRSTPLAGL